MKISIANKARMAALGVVIMAGTSACGGAATPEAVGSEARPLNLGWIQPSGMSMDVQVALSEGMFKDNGLKVETITGKSGPELISSVISKTSDIAIVPTDGAMGALDKGQDLVVLPPFVSLNLDLVANPKTVDVSTGSLAGLKGKVIGVTALGAITERFARTLLTEAGLDPDKDVTFLPVGVGPAALAAYSHGQVDAMVQTPSANVRFRESGSEVTVLASSTKGTAGEIGTYGLTGFHVASREFVDAHPETIKNYCASMTKAVSWMTDPANQEASLAELSTATALPAEQLAEVFDQEIGVWGMEIDEDRWKKNVEFANAKTELGFDKVVQLCK